ncbi:MAG: O-methyltransferase [Deltaproteobacteria bacterium]|nr:MAG: O-methyltransferase [Deltaproteobacteria bacterium]
MADKETRSGARPVGRDVLQYADELHAGLDDALRRAFDAADGDDIPAIQLGWSEARLVELLMKLIGARRVVEIGTLAGFSAIRIARGLAPDGHLWTIESDRHHAAVAEANILAAGLQDRVTVVAGAALDVLPRLEAHGPFDAVFIDADKQNYDKYGEWAARNTRPGGLLLGDNAYYFGKLLDLKDAGAAAMRAFHEHARDHYETVCIPTPDGMLLGIRRAAAE